MTVNLKSNLYVGPVNTFLFFLNNDQTNDEKDK